MQVSTTQIHPDTDLEEKFAHLFCCSSLTGSSNFQAFRGETEKVMRISISPPKSMAPFPKGARPKSIRTQVQYAPVVSKYLYCTRDQSVYLFYCILARNNPFVSCYLIVASNGPSTETIAPAPQHPPPALPRRPRAPVSSCLHQIHFASSTALLEGSTTLHDGGARL